MPREPMTDSTKVRPPVDPTCPECRGRGYDAFHCDGIGHTPIELQSNDGCGCLADRIDGGPPNDDSAALAFVRDLETGDAWALEVAATLAEYGGPIMGDDD